MSAAESSEGARRRLPWELNSANPLCRCYRVYVLAAQARSRHTTDVELLAVDVFHLDVFFLRFFGLVAAKQGVNCGLGNQLPRC